MRKKLIIAIACLSVVLCTLISGTIAYLIAETNTIENTFAPSNIDLMLTETPATFDGKMIPGKILEKKATVKVTADIPCYVFVEVVKANDVDNFIGYTVDTAAWTPLTTNDGKTVYYKAVASGAENGMEIDILAAGGTAPYAWGKNQVLVLPTITKTMMDALYKDGATMPTLTFKAYAIQSDYLAYPADAEGATDQQKADAKALFAWNTLKANPNPKVDTAAVG